MPSASSDVAKDMADKAVTAKVPTDQNVATTVASAAMEYAAKIIKMGGRLTPGTIHSSQVFRITWGTQKIKFRES